MPPLRTNYSKRRLRPAELKEQIEDLIQNFSPDVAGQFHELVEAYRPLRTVTAREAHYLVLNEWKRHGDETKFSQFMTEKIAELTKRLEQQEKNRLRTKNTDTGPEYRRLATSYLQSNFTPEALGQILNSPHRLKELGSALFKKCDADILAKCPEVFESVEEVIKWRRINHHPHSIKSLLLRALPSDLRQTLSPHSAGESALESLACAAAAALAADTHDAQSGEPEPQDAFGSNFGYHDMCGFDMYHNAIATVPGSRRVSIEMTDASYHGPGINSASEAGECREGGSAAAAIATPTPTGREGELPFPLQVRGRGRRCNGLTA
jgi:hypothetical protein